MTPSQWHLVPQSIPPLAVGAILIGLGLLTYVKNRRAVINRWFALLCWSLSFWYFSFGIALNAISIRTYFVWFKIGHIAVMFTPVIYVAFTARLLGLGRLRRAASWYAVFAAVLYAIMWTTNWYFSGDIYHYAWGIYPKTTPLLTFHALLTLFSVVGCYVFFLQACRQAKRRGLREQYNRLKYMCLALTLFGCAPLDYIPKFGIPVYPFGFVFTLSFALIVTYAILKHHVMDINLVFQKGLVYSILVAGVTLVYLVAVLLAEKLFQGFLGYESIIGTLLAAVIIAIGFIPLRNAAQRFVDRALFKATPAELATQRDQLLAEVRKSDQMKAVATFAAGMAHEIKNPLTAIKTFTEFLPEKYDDPSFREKFTRIVGKEVGKIDQLVHHLLDFAKPASPQLHPLQLSELLDETLDLLSNDCLQRRVHVERTYSPTGTIQADPQQLRQVFLNLFLNSLEAMDGQGGTLTVSTTPQDGHLTVTITDTGPGIPKEHLSHLGEPFFTTKPAGTGLGLSIVHSIIQEHGGRITFKNRATGGACCTLLFPLAPQGSGELATVGAPSNKKSCDG